VSKIGDALAKGKSMGDEEESSSSDVASKDEDDIALSEDEIAAGKLAGLDETKAKAMKAFCRLCCEDM
jgi:hypothetical protein